MIDSGPVRVAFVASTFGVGGAERVLCDVITGVDRARFDLRIYFLREAGTMGRRLFDEGLPVAESLSRGRFDGAHVVRLAREFRRERFDIVFCADHHNAMFAGRAAAIASGVSRRVIGSHSTGLFGRRGSFTRVDRLLMEFTDTVVAVSDMHASYLVEVEGVDAGRVHVICNGVDVDRAGAPAGTRERVRADLGLEASSSVVLMVAAMRPEKAHGNLLAAVRRLRDNGRTVQVLLAGDGTERATLERQVLSEKLGDCVRFLGVRADVARLLHAADVLVLPSLGVVETLPLAVLEAMAAGLPVVASRVGSLPEVIESGRNGLLVPPGDVPALATAIAEVLDDRARAERMAAAAKETVRARYTMAQMIAGYETLFEELTQQRMSA